MVSRKDELLSSFDTALADLRTSLTAPRNDPARHRPQSAGSLSGRLHNTFNVLSPLLHGHDGHRESSAGSSSDALVVARPRMRSVSQPGYDLERRGLSPAAQASGDELPNYSRRQPLPAFAITPPAATNSPIPPLTYSFKSSSGKLVVRMEAPSGGSVPTLLHGTDQEVRGTVTVCLGDIGEPVSEIRVKCKGVASTRVMKTRGRGGATGSLVQDDVNSVPTVEEVTFLHADRSLFTPIPAAIDFNLTGTRTFPFTFSLPPKIPGSSETLPPSFTLTSPPNAISTFGGDTANVEWASVKYYLKVTLARRGFFRTNERLFAPFVLRMQPSPLVRSLPIPEPSDDPASWMGQRVRKEVKGGAARGNTAWYDVTVLLPTPPVYDRRQPTPFFLKLLSSNPGITGDFPASSISALLYQRVKLTASETTGVHERLVGQGSIQPDGPRGGVVESRGGDWCRRYKGELKFGLEGREAADCFPTFCCPNIAVEYHMVVKVVGHGRNNYARIILPIKLSSTPRLRGSSNAVAGSSGAGDGSDAAEAVDLPPSYFEVREMDRREGRRRGETSS